MTKKPNVVFLFTDDQRFDTIAALGNPAIITPNLDRLVGRGTAFTHAHIPGGTVGAICMPSRAMLHTGRTLFHVVDSGQSVPESHALLGETFQQAGYAAFGTGKWHNGKRAYARSFSAGGEVMFGGMADHWNVPMYHWDPSGRYDALSPQILDPWSTNTVVQRHMDHIHHGRHSTDIVADHTVEFIKAHRDDRPYFVYTAFLAPHDPRSMPQRYLDMYDPEAIELPAAFAPQHPFDYEQSQIRDEVLAPYPRPAAEIKRHIAEYYAMITHLDDAIGRIYQAVADRGELDNTIFVFAGDNGLACGKHGLMGKQNAYDHSARVPLLFAGPGVPVGARRSTYAYLLDIFPTLCDLVGIAIPDTVEGASLLPALKDAATPARDEVFFVYENTVRMVKDQRHKLILYSTPDGNYAQLFDLAHDPDELVNLLAQPTVGSAGTAQVSVAANSHAAGSPSAAGTPGTPAPVAAPVPTQQLADSLFARLERYAERWDDQQSRWGRQFWQRFNANGGLAAAVARMPAR